MLSLLEVFFKTYGNSFIDTSVKLLNWIVVYFMYNHAKAQIEFIKLIKNKR